MGQRKLTDEELQDVMGARAHMRRVALFAKTMHPFYEVVQILESIATHGTTDGRPYVEPQPKIGEGYRVATEADVKRRDLEFFSKIQGNIWVRRAKGNQPLSPNYHYRVPVDRIPTDDDAIGRPAVMAKDLDCQKWHIGRLIEVQKGVGRKFCVRLNSDDVSHWWEQCRFPYPGELD